MQNEISALKDELSKFTDFTMPESVRSLANEAVSFLNRRDIPLPICESESTVIRITATIFMNAKLSKSSPNLVLVVLSIIKNDLIVGNALDTILKALFQYASEVDCEGAMALMKTAPSQIIENFPHLASVRVIMSLVLTLMNHRNELVASSAFAMFPNVLDSLVKKIIKFDGDGEKFKEELTNSKFKSQFEKFDNPYYFILYLLFNDLTSIALKQPLQWLQLNFQKITVIYDVLELIINTYNQLLQSEPQLICIFESAIIQSMNDNNALQFIITFIETFLDSHVSLCMSLFDEFLSKLSTRNKQIHAPLFFFRSIATRKKGFAAKFFILCDSNGTTLATLFKSLQKLIESTEINEHLAFSLNQIRWNLIHSVSDEVSTHPDSPISSLEKSQKGKFPKSQSNPKIRRKSDNLDKAKDKFIKTSPFEIIFGFTQSFCESEPNACFGKFVDDNFSCIFNIALTAMKYSNLETFIFPCKLLSNVLKLLKASNLSDFSEIFDFVCNLKIDAGICDELYKNFQIFDKIGLYHNFLAELAENNPDICSNKWMSILSSVFHSRTTLSLDFAQNYPDNELVSITESSVKINPLPFNFIANFISSNINRFSIIWPVLESFFQEKLDELPSLHLNDQDVSESPNPDSLNNEKIPDRDEFDVNDDKDTFDINVLNLILELIDRCIFEESERPLMNLLHLYLSDRRLHPQNAEKILTQVRHVISESSGPIVKNCWPEFFNILSPNNFGDETELFHLAFNVLTLICNDHISYIPSNTMPDFINLVISYSDCTADINLSLSSFDLLWNIVRIIGNNVQNWMKLMNELLRLIHDPRNDISQCAIRTFFSLVSSNFKQMPNEVIEYFIKTGFCNILDGFDMAEAKIAPCIELALQELAHHASSFWLSFNQNPSFTNELLPHLIDKATEFCTLCTNYEIISNAFQFFQIFFECKYLDSKTSELLREAIFKMAEKYFQITDLSCMIFSTYGRLVNRILLTLKTRNDLKSLPKWYPLIKKAIHELHSEGYVHITPQRMLDIIPSLFPMVCVDTQDNEKPKEENPEIESLSSNSNQQANELTDTCVSVFEFLNELGESEDAENSSHLRDFIFDLITRIYETKMSNSLRLKLIIICKNLLLKDKSEIFAKLIVESDTIIQDSQIAAEMFICYSNISSKWQHLQPQARTKTVSILGLISKEMQLEFIEKNKSNFTVIKSIWSTYFEPSSPDFNQIVYDTCFNLIIDAITELLADVRSQTQILTFLKNSSTPSVSFNGSKPTNKSHLLRLIVPLTSLITSRKEDVRNAVQKNFVLISDIISSMS